VSYAQEQDDLPWEARRGVAFYARFWPKSGGQNVLVEETPLPTFEVYDPSGTRIQGPTNVVVSNSGTPSVSQVICEVAPISTLGEGYTCRISWQVDGALNTELEVRTFDVVLWPFGGTRCSLNDLLDEVPDCGFILDRLGELLGYSLANNAARIAYAGSLCYRARVELEAMIRSSMYSGSSGTSESQAPALNREASWLRPHLILNRQAFDRCERMLALAMLYEAIADAPVDGDGENDQKARFYRTRAEAAFKSAMPLRYDSSEDLVPDEEIGDLGRVVYHRRVQA
jgi:hypothetical protein